MKLRRLGPDGPLLSVLGIGTWQAAGAWLYGLGGADEERSIAVLRRAFDGGVNWVDTAPIYGGGHAESVVARALRGYDHVLVNTKCGHFLAPDGKSSYSDLRPEKIRRDCEGSLRRLGRDHIDVYMFHLPDATHSLDDAWAEMVRLREEGKVRWIGACNHPVAALERLPGVQCGGGVYSLLHRGAEEDALPWCEAHGIGYLCYETQATGLLTGAFTRDRLASLPADDYRRTGQPDFQEPWFSQALDLVERLRPLAADLGLTVGALAIAYTLAHPGLTAAMVGASKPEQVDGWLPVGALDLPSDVAAAVRRAAQEAGFGTAADADYAKVLEDISGASRPSSAG